MIGNHAALMASCSSPFGEWNPHWTPSSSEVGWRKWGHWLIASCRLCVYSLKVGRVGNVWVPTCFWDVLLSQGGIFVHAAHLQKIMVLGRRRSVWFCRCTGDPKWSSVWIKIVVRTLALCKEECTSCSPSRRRTHGSIICHSINLHSKTNKKTQRRKKKQQKDLPHFLVFCRFLDSRKKNKTEKEATFLY